ncbi:MAG: prepilin-type N-terminal cleavage/methylation domain-containing protein [Zavarzinella sp.]
MKRSTAPRSAFTLIELLVAISIMLAIMALAALVLPALRQRDNTTKGTNQVQGYLSLAKQRAIRDQAPRGVRFYASLEDPNLCTEMAYIEQPEPFLPPTGTSVTISPAPPIAGVPPASIASLSGGQIWDGVRAGDFLEVTYGGGFISQILDHNSLGIALAPTQVLLSQQIKGGSSLTITDGYRVLRQPTELIGETHMQLPPRVRIRIPSCQPGNWTGRSMDVLFNSGGLVADQGSGKVILYVEPEEDGAGEPLLVVIYTHSGQIITHPVAEGADPFLFTRDGAGSGL